MLHSLGAVLLLLGGTTLGLRASGALRGRVRVMEELEHGLELLERELQLHMTPLPELLLQLGPRCAAGPAGLFAVCLAGLETGEGMAQSWARGVQGLSGLCDDGRRALLALGQVLGRYEAQEQCQAIAAARQELARLRRLRWEDSRRLGRVYCALGATAGAFCAIVLL